MYEKGRKGNDSMRKNLEGLVGQTHRYRGIFIRYGRSQYHEGYVPTVLISDIIRANVFITDHLWIMGRTVDALRNLSLVQGDWIEFSAKVVPYRHKTKIMSKLTGKNKDDYALEIVSGPEAPDPVKIDPHKNNVSEFLASVRNYAEELRSLDKRIKDKKTDNEDGGGQLWQGE